MIRPSPTEPLSDQSFSMMPTRSLGMKRTPKMMRVSRSSTPKAASQMLPVVISATMRVIVVIMIILPHACFRHAIDERYASCFRRETHRHRAPASRAQPADLQALLNGYREGGGLYACGSR